MVQIISHPFSCKICHDSKKIAHIKQEKFQRENAVKIIFFAALATIINISQKANREYMKHLM
jgi:hypothetical protein